MLRSNFSRMSVWPQASHFSQTSGGISSRWRLGCRGFLSFFVHHAIRAIWGRREAGASVGRRATQALYRDDGLNYSPQRRGGAEERGEMHTHAENLESPRAGAFRDRRSESREDRPERQVVRQRVTAERLERQPRLRTRQTLSAPTIPPRPSLEMRANTPTDNQQASMNDPP